MTKRQGQTKSARKHFGCISCVPTNIITTYSLPMQGWHCYRLSLNAFPTTVIELNAMAIAATMGFSLPAAASGNAAML